MCQRETVIVIKHRKEYWGTFQMRVLAKQSSLSLHIEEAALLYFV